MDKTSFAERLQSFTNNEEDIKKNVESLKENLGEENLGKVFELRESNAILNERMAKKGINLEEMTKEGKLPTGEVYAEAHNIAKSSDGMKMFKEVKDSGLNTKAMAANFRREQQMTKKFNDRNKVFRKAVIITKNRQLKEVEVWDGITTEIVITKIQTTKETHSTSFKRLQIEDLSDHTIKIFYDPTLEKNKNKRASILFSFPVGGNVLIMSEKKDLTIKQIEKIEKTLKINDNIKKDEKLDPIITKISKENDENNDEEFIEIDSIIKTDESIKSTEVIESTKENVETELLEILEQEDIETELLEILEQEEKQEPKKEPKKEVKNENPFGNIDPNQLNGLFQEGMQSLKDGKKPNKATLDKFNKLFPNMIPK